MQPLNLEQEMQMARAQGAAKIVRDNLIALESIGRNGFCGTPEAFDRYMKELTGSGEPQEARIAWLEAGLRDIGEWWRGDKALAGDLGGFVRARLEGVK